MSNNTTDAAIAAEGAALLVLIVHDKAKKNLEARHLEAIPEAVENQGRWLFALWQAKNHRESCDESDLAHMFFAGMPAIGTCAEEALLLCDPNPLIDQTNEFLAWLREQ